MIQKHINHSYLDAAALWPEVVQPIRIGLPLHVDKHIDAAGDGLFILIGKRNFDCFNFNCVAFKYELLIEVNCVAFEYKFLIEVEAIDTEESIAGSSSACSQYQNYDSENPHDSIIASNWFIWLNLPFNSSSIFIYQLKQ